MRVLGGVICGVSVLSYLVVLLLVRLVSSQIPDMRLILSGLVSVLVVGIGLVAFGTYRDRHEQRK